MTPAAAVLAQMSFVDRKCLRAYATRDPNLGDDSWSPWLQSLLVAAVVELDAIEAEEAYADALRRAQDAAVIEAMDAPLRAEHAARVEAADAVADWSHVAPPEPRTEEYWPLGHPEEPCL
jgi:hypothetical protein